MTWRAKGAVGVILFCMLACMCGAQGDPPRLKGVAISPPGFPNTFENIFDFMEDVGSWTNSVLMWNGPWQDDPDGPPPGIPPRAPGFIWSNAAVYGYTPVQVFGWRDGTHLLLAVPGNATNDWTNEEARSLFIGMLTNYAVQMPSPYIFIGNENDFYYRQDPDDYTNWVAFYHEAYDALKAVAPTTLVGTVFSYEHMAGIGGLNAWTNQYWEALELFDLDRIDIVGITTYPFLGLASPDLMPHTYYQPLLDRIGDRRIAFTEIGWPAENLFDFELPWDASEPAQVGFLEYLSLALFDKNVEILQWPFLHRLAEPIETNDWWRLFASVSLYDADENPRPAYAAFHEFPILAMDRDGDGIPDWWEITHFDGPTNAVAGADDDGDGHSNAAEFATGTDPNNPDSVLRVQPDEIIEGVFAIRWPGAPERAYRIGRSTNLPVFVPIATNIPADPPVNTYSDPTATNGGPYFYRVELEWWTP